MDYSENVVTAKDNDERQWGMFAHLASFVGFVGVPFGNILGPLVVWLIKKDEMPFVDDQGKEALNFQITLLIAGLISGVLALVIIGFVLVIILLVADIVYTIQAAIAANKGTCYRYPYTIRFIK